MRPVRILCCIVACLPVPLASGASSPEATPDSAAVPAPLYALPTWRLEADPFNQYGSYSLGVYRRIGAQWDLGLRFATGVGDRNGQGIATSERWDVPTVTSELTRRNSFSLGVTVQARTWYPLGRRVAFFLGPQVSYRYGSVTSGEGRLTERDARVDVINVQSMDERTQRWGTGLALGGDLILLPRLSISIALLPVSYSYAFGHRDYRYVEATSGRLDVEDRREEFRNSGFVTDLRGEFFVSFHLQPVQGD